MAATSRLFFISMTRLLYHVSGSIIVNLMASKGEARREREEQYAFYLAHNPQFQLRTEQNARFPRIAHQRFLITPPKTKSFELKILMRF